MLNQYMSKHPSRITGWSSGNACSLSELVNTEKKNSRQSLNKLLAAAAKFDEQTWRNDAESAQTLPGARAGVPKTHRRCRASEKSE